MTSLSNNQRPVSRSLDYSQPIIFSLKSFLRNDICSCLCFCQGFLAEVDMLCDEHHCPHNIFIIKPQWALSWCLKSWNDIVTKLSVHFPNYSNTFTFIGWKLIKIFSNSRINRMIVLSHYSFKFFLLVNFSSCCIFHIFLKNNFKSRECWVNIFTFKHYSQLKPTQDWIAKLGLL